MPKILILDIETLPNVVLSWGLWVDGALSHDNILKERTILCAAWKWADKAEVHSMHAKNGKDKRLVKKLRDVISEADAVVTHHGDKFDLPWINTRILYHGLKPARPYISLDTKKMAKKFYFNNNRLDYLGQFLKLGKKIKTDYQLWLKCMDGDPDAIEEMLRYNRQDVKLLEQVYLRLRPFVAARFNAALSGDAEDRRCPTCRGASLISRGYGQTRASTFQRFQCKGCGAWSQKPIKSKVIR